MARKMKDSGIEWIGEIPEGWEVIPAKFLFKNSDIRRIADDEQLTSSQQFGIISQKDYTELTGSKVVLANKGLADWKHVEPFDFIISLRSFQGGLEMSEITGCITWHYIVLKPCHKICSYYYKWLFKSDSYIRALQRTCSFIRDGQDLRYSNFIQVPLFEPPLAEQEKIADYLNAECFRIDAMLTKTRSSIEEYKKLKQAVITQAVTKGVRGERKMKDSGVEWIGKVPSKWNCIKIKYLFEIRKRIAGKEGYTVLSITQTGIKPKNISSNEGQLADSYSNYQLLHFGEFAMNHMDLLTGWVDISNYNGVTSPDYRVFSLKDTITNHPRYFLYLMQMCYFNRIFYSMAQGVSNLGRWRLQSDKFLNCIFPVPSIEEQKEISDYLDTTCSEIDKLIAKKEQLVKELESYKKSLIYEVVTGKREG